MLINQARSQVVRQGGGGGGGKGGEGGGGGKGGGGGRGGVPRDGLLSTAKRLRA